MPLLKENYEAIIKQLKGIGVVDNTALKTYLQKKQVATNTIVQKVLYKVGEKIPVDNAMRLSESNLKELEKFIQHLTLHAYSKSTINTYRNEFKQLLQLLKQKKVESLTPEDLKRYMYYAMEKEGISENTAHSRLNALKYYFEKVLGKEKFFWEILRPKKPLQLPNVLGEKELTKLFNALVSKKYKAILFTAYSAGLRVSETMSLKLIHIDSDRMQIKVENSKGKKDRYVGLSPVVLDVLRQYVKVIVPKPTIYLFEGEIAGKPYAIRSAQKVFQRAKEKAGIRKEVSFHSLRHSFATHLLEKGIDIKYIKEILGHFNIKTTERYTHVSKSALITIKSPLDDLWLKGDII